MDTLTSIKVFRQVVESGSFASAAERLEMSTAAVSKHVRSAEQRLGVRLLNRNSRNLSLTEPGSLYFERCKNILDDLQATELELGCLSAVPRGTLRVSCPSWYAGQRMATLLAEYRRRYPEVVIDISFEDRFVGLIEEGYDLALRIVGSRQSLPGGLIARPVGPAAFCLAASREYLEGRGMPGSAEELSHHDFVAVGNSTSVTLNGPSGDQQVPIRVVMRYRSMDGVVSAVAAGIGIAPIPTVCFGDSRFEGILRPVLAEQRLCDATLYVVYASRTFVPPKLRTFAAFICEALSPAPELDPSTASARSQKRGYVREAFLPSLARFGAPGRRIPQRAQPPLSCCVSSRCTARNDHGVWHGREFDGAVNGQSEECANVKG
jgi:DNA-binding transcriptional LysR family regulator